jgi:DNA-binding GntR family transcriptional regulator
MRSKDINLITIDRRSAVAYDQQVKESIKALILDQTFYYQTKLPKPKELCSHLNIESKSVLSAYDQLVKERFIQHTGSEDYRVAYIELTNSFFDRNTAIYDAIITLGLEPSIECLTKKIIHPTAEELIAMGFAKDERIFYINRIYKGNQQPIIMLENYLPMSIFPEIDKKFIGTEPLNDFLTETYGIHVKISKRRTKAVNLSPELAKRLNERKNAASISSTNHIYDDQDRLIDYGRSHTVSSYYFQGLTTKDELFKYTTKGEDNE